jgi:hypothetical protein
MDPEFYGGVDFPWHQLWSQLLCYQDVSSHEDFQHKGGPRTYRIVRRAAFLLGSEATASRLSLATADQSHSAARSDNLV